MSESPKQGPSYCNRFAAETVEKLRSAKLHARVAEGLKKQGRL
jgi:hypothetical protein